MYLDDIKVLLINETNIFINSYNDSSDIVCFLTAYSSQNPDLTFEGNLIRYPHFQVIVRDTSYANAWSRAESILDTLNGETNIIPISDIISLGQDDKKRTSLSINFEIIIT